MVIDLVIVAGGFVAFAIYFWIVGKLTRKPVPAPAPPPVPVALRLAADHRERLSRAHVSTVRVSDTRLALRQRAERNEWKKRNG